MRPPLSNPREEAFAQALARGLRHDPAAAEAGLALDHKAARSLGRRMDISDRANDLRAVWDKARRADLPNTIVGLLDLAEGFLGAPAGAMREARLARVQAHRLWEAHQSREELARAPLGSDLGEPELDEPELSEDEWIERYGASRADLPA